MPRVCAYESQQPCQSATANKSRREAAAKGGALSRANKLNCPLWSTSRSSAISGQKAANHSGERLVLPDRIELFRRESDLMSSSPPRADIRQIDQHAREVPNPTTPGHSITSSASASNEGGTMTPSVLAALRLTMNVNLAGCSIGRSAGLAPFKILST